MLKDAFVITKVFASNTEVVDTAIFTCPEGAEYEVTEVMEEHTTLGTNGSAVTMDVVKAASGTAVAGATTLLQSTFNMKSTVDTPVRKTVANSGLVTARGTRTLTAGQKLGLDFTGTLTALAGVCVTVVLRLRRPALNR